MKFSAAILVVAFLALSAFAGARVVVSSLPEAVRPDAEVSTNIALNVNAARLQTLTLSVEFDSCVTDEVLVAIGAAADLDGNLSVDEADIVFGCDCGAWYRADLRTGVVEVAMTNALTIGKCEFWSKVSDPSVYVLLYKLVFGTQVSIAGNRATLRSLCPLRLKENGPRNLI